MVVPSLPPASGVSVAVTGLSLYAYRFVLYLTVPCAYFSARGLGLLWAAPGRAVVGGIGLVALATAGSLFGYGVWQVLGLPTPPMGDLLC